MPVKEPQIAALVARQRDYFASGASRGYATRIAALKSLQAALLRYEPALHAALAQDLGKPEFEAYLGETGFCRQELKETIAKLRQWMQPRRVPTPWWQQPAASTIYYEPLGVNLIISPYNYPVMLTLSPLIAALAAGNTAVVKSSELTPAASAVIRELLGECLAPEYVVHIPGGVEETTLLLAEQFDHIFFTGSARVGAIVMRAAASHLTPVTLELGGKSPCIVHHDARMELAVKRITQGKFFNCGQTCVAPDYVLVHRQREEEFLTLMKARITACYGRDPILSPDYGRIVNDGHCHRIAGLIEPSKVVVGGQVDLGQRYIAPTLLGDITLADKAMGEEIFGPVLPVLAYEELDEVHALIAKLPRHPLACYLFSESGRVQREVLGNIQFGGGGINNCLMHLANAQLPFGGVGGSGMGAYHGFHGFERFSHRKGVLKSATWFDLPLAYAPYGDKIKWLRRVWR